MPVKTLAFALALALPAAAGAQSFGVAPADEPAATPASVPAAEMRTAEIRELAEIDGDQATFTVREQEKHDLLLQLLGANALQR